MINVGDMERRVGVIFREVEMLLGYILDECQDIFYSLLIYIGDFYVKEVFSNA